MTQVDLSAGPLAGIRVLDVATMLAAPYGATLLGDMGADVIKVESPIGDDSRHLGPEKGGERSPFLSMNRNKRGVVLDLTKESARAAFGKLAATSDVVITNTREPALTKLGLNYEQVRANRPDVIWVFVSAFGADGPYAGRPGIDFLAQCIAGLVAVNGDPDGDPVRVTVPLVDVMASLLVANGVQAALRARELTGEGQRIDISLLDTLVHAQCSFLGNYFLAKEVVPRTGNRSQYFAPSGVYLCKDGKRAAITCPSNKFFRHLSAALEVDWAEDERFRKIPGRLENQDELDRLIGERCAELTRDELLARLHAADVLTAPVNELPDVVLDPQILHNGMITKVEHPTVGTLEVTNLPIHFGGTPGGVRLPPPVLGQHTAEILSEVGCDEASLEALESEGAIVRRSVS